MFAPTPPIVRLAAARVRLAGDRKAERRLTVSPTARSVAPMAEGSWLWLSHTSCGKKGGGGVQANVCEHARCCCKQLSGEASVARQGNFHSRRQQGGWLPRWHAQVAKAGGRRRTDTP